MVTLKRASLTENFENLKQLQQQLLQLRDFGIEINRTELNFYKKQVIFNILEVCQGKIAVIIC